MLHTQHVLNNTNSKTIKQLLALPNWTRPLGSDISHQK